MSKDKPFPWGCTCGQDAVMPDGSTLTCRNCGEQWANSYDPEGQYPFNMKELADLMEESAMLLTALNSYHGRHDVIARLLREAQNIKDHWWVAIHRKESEVGDE